jgi:curved DNA-binding protein CbpA
MSRRETNTNPKPSSLFRECEHLDCHEAGEFRAPKSRLLDRGNPEDYQWFCLAHIREFNKSWNFFDGMSDDEVLRYKDEDITGHRPTWKMGSRTAKSRHDFNYDDPFDFGEEMGTKDSSRNNGKSDAPPIDKQERDALAVLNLRPGSSLNDIKRRHKELAKKYHPDIRGGDKKAEEILKNINQAYTHLRSCANSY